MSGHVTHRRHMENSAIAALHILQADCPMTRRRRAVCCLRVFFTVTVQTFERYLVVAMLIYFISGDFDVALHFLMTKSARSASSVSATFEGSFRDVRCVLLDDESFAMTCALELCYSQGSCRIQAEQFIMEVILVARIMEAARRGLALPLHAVVDEYLGL